MPQVDNPLSGTPSRSVKEGLSHLMAAWSVGLGLLVGTCAAGASESHCDDPAAIAEWNEMAHKYAGSDPWQRLHALWLGLCQKIREGSIEYNRAVDLFERERQETIQEMRRRQIRPRLPFG